MDFGRLIYYAVFFVVLQTIISGDESIEEYSKVLNLKFFKLKDGDHGYSERIMGLNGVVGLERTAIQDGDSLRVLEITNGSLIVQLVFSPYEILIDCDISNSRHHIYKLLKHVSSKREKKSKFIFDDKSAEIVNLTDMVGWINSCNAFHMNQLALESGNDTGEIIDPIESKEDKMMRLEKAGNNSDNKTRQKKASIRREKRGITDLLYPGTKWCGKGNSSAHYHDLGELRHTDKCCRHHDFCKQTIPAFTSGYYYFNYGLLTISSCACDNRFKRCLQKVATRYEDTLADLIGHIYFNVIGMTCFNIRERDYCTKSSFWGRCLKSKRAKMAVFDEILSY